MLVLLLQNQASWTYWQLSPSLPWSVFLSPKTPSNFTAPEIEKDKKDSTDMVQHCKHYSQVFCTTINWIQESMSILDLRLTSYKRSFVISYCLVVFFREWINNAICITSIVSNHWVFNWWHRVSPVDTGYAIIVVTTLGLWKLGHLYSSHKRQPTFVSFQWRRLPASSVKFIIYICYYTCNSTSQNLVHSLPPGNIKSLTVIWTSGGLYKWNKTKFNISHVMYLGTNGWQMAQ